MDEPDAPGADALVVTVTRNKRAVAEQTIPFLKQRTRRPFRYAVVANGDLDSGEWLLANRASGWFDHLAIVSENLGVGPAYNLFWRHAVRFNRELKYVVKMDDSNVPDRADWLDELIALADYYQTRVGMVGFLIEGNDKPWPVQDWDGWRVRPTPQNCSGSCCLIPRHVWELVGLWDEEVLGWLGPARDKGPVYYAREDGMMGMLTLMAGFQNVYHEDLTAVRCVGEKNEKPEYVQWKLDQYNLARGRQTELAADYARWRRTLPHRPSI